MNKQKSFEEIKKIIAEHKDELTRKYKIREIGVFGSVVRGEQTKKSDIDILVLATESFLSSILNQKVDLIPRKAVKGKFEKNILKDLILI